EVLRPGHGIVEPFAHFSNPGTLTRISMRFGNPACAALEEDSRALSRDSTPKPAITPVPLPPGRSGTGDCFRFSEAAALGVRASVPAAPSKTAPARRCPRLRPR